jgi:hypothetical protein
MMTSAGPSAPLERRARIASRACARVWIVPLGETMMRADEDIAEAG